MRKYRVYITRAVTEVFMVRANSKEEAMNLAIDDCDEDYCKLVGTDDGDPECDYNEVHDLGEEND